MVRLRLSRKSLCSGSSSFLLVGAGDAGRTARRRSHAGWSVQLDLPVFSTKKIFAGNQYIFSFSIHNLVCPPWRSRVPDGLERDRGLVQP